MACINPYSVDGVDRMCHKDQCPHCRFAKRHWLTGRIAAEMFSADHIRFVTLTYDDANHGSAGTAHIKEYVNNRRRTYGFKHFTVLEYGEQRGRAHWHSLQMYYGPCPAEPLDVALPDQLGWAKGTSQYETVRSIAGSVGYIMGYLDKGGLSCRPSPNMGTEYLIRYAQHRARNRHRLTDREDRLPFTVPGVRKKASDGGALWVYYVPTAHRVAGLMAEAYNSEWETLFGELPSDPLRNIKYG